MALEHMPKTECVHGYVVWWTELLSTSISSTQFPKRFHLFNTALNILEYILK